MPGTGNKAEEISKAPALVEHELQRSVVLNEHTQCGHLPPRHLTVFTISGSLCCVSLVMFYHNNSSSSLIQIIQNSDSGTFKSHYPPEELMESLHFICQFLGKKGRGSARTLSTFLRR